MTQEKISLKASKREITGKKVSQIRKAGFIPAVLYGNKIEPQAISINMLDFVKAFEKAGTSSLIDLKIDEASQIKVLTHEPQIDPVRGFPIHVDFYKVRMDEKIKTEIPLEFIGESDAEKNQDGTLVTNRDNVEVECLPSDLVHNIEIDITSLKTFEDQITVADIKIPQGIEILTDMEEVIAFVEPPRSEEEMAELEESAADEEQEAIDKMGSEGETAEGDGQEQPEESKEE